MFIYYFPKVGWQLATLSVILFFFSIPQDVFSQTQLIWSDVNNRSSLKVGEMQIVPDEYRTVKADVKALASILQNAPSELSKISVGKSTAFISLPLPDGTNERFSILESSIMEPALSAKFPETKTYFGQSTNNPAVWARFDLTPAGFHAIISTKKGLVFIDPYERGNREIYISYFQNDYKPPIGKEKMECGAELEDREENLDMRSALIPSGNDLRTYRLAVAADSGYYNFHGATIGLTMAAIVTSFNRVNFFYEREISVRFVLIADNDDLIFTGSTHPFTTNNACDLRAENQVVIDGIIGSDNYDVGHLVFLRPSGFSGCAGGSLICDDDFKAWGTSGSSNPIGDGYDVRLICHEMGHQFGAGHSWNGNQGNCTDGQYSSNNAYEPGSGTTIMSYAGTCGSDNIIGTNDQYFHVRSLEQMIVHSTMGGGNGCPTTSNTGNSVPTVNAGPSYTIPISTPFMLTGSGNDADGDPLSYCWEQYDLGPRGPANNAFTTGPIFRSFPPINVNFRIFPQLSDILNNTNTLGEILPAIDRDLNFRLTVRDNLGGGGGVDWDQVTLDVDGTKGPFAITNMNLPTTLCPGPNTITWSVNSTDDLALNVNILLSYDGGLNFTQLLVAGTPNDGSQEVNIPCTFSNTARFKVEAVGNIFFDISNANVTVGDNTEPTFTRPPDVIVYTDDDCNYDASVGVTGDVIDEDDNCSIGMLEATSEDQIIEGSCEGQEKILRTWTLVDNCGNTNEQIQVISARDTTSPTFTVPGNITIFKDDNCEHDASVSETGDVTDEADNCTANLDASFSDEVTPGSCVGEELITRSWYLEDDCGNNLSQTQMIMVKDTTPPSITDVAADPDMLWPPNHKMRDVFIQYTAVDNCSEVSNVLTVESNEPVNGNGDGNTDPDWIIVDDQNVKLRAERSGHGNGRIYTITITSTDDCGNSSTANTTVLVPHDRRGPFKVLSQNIGGSRIMEIYPNPASDFVNARINLNAISAEFHGKEDISNYQINVTDITGRVVNKLKVSPYETIIFGTHLQPGSYFISLINSETTIEIQKFIKVK